MFIIHHIVITATYYTPVYKVGFNSIHTMLNAHIIQINYKIYDLISTKAAKSTSITLTKHYVDKYLASIHNVWTIHEIMNII